MSVPLSGYATPVPATPSGLVVTYSHATHLKLKWDPSTDTYHKRYDVYRSDDNFTTETLIKSPRLTEMLDRHLEVGTWYYRIVDVDIFDLQSEASAIVSFEITEQLPFTETFSVATPTVKDINTALGRNANTGTILNDGPATCAVELSYDGSTYPRSFTLNAYASTNLEDVANRIAIDSIRFTSTGATVTVVAI